MIDKIVVTLDDSGRFQVNVGDVHFIKAHNIDEVAYLVKQNCKKLACFPSGKYPISANPISLDDFKKKKND